MLEGSIPEILSRQSEKSPPMSPRAQKGRRSRAFSHSLEVIGTRVERFSASVAIGGEAQQDVGATVGILSIVFIPPQVGRGLLPSL